MGGVQGMALHHGLARFTSAPVGVERRPDKEDKGWEGHCIGTPHKSSGDTLERCSMKTRLLAYAFVSQDPSGAVPRREVRI